MPVALLTWWQSAWLGGCAVSGPWNTSSPHPGPIEGRLRVSPTHQSLLDAMDGIAMILDHDLRITRIGVPNWHASLNENPPPDPAVCNPSSEDALGRPVTDFFVGDVVRATYATLFNQVLSGARPVVRVDCRCDAPTLRRGVRFSVSPIASGGGVRHLLISRSRCRFSSARPSRFLALPLRIRTRMTSSRSAQSVPAWPGPSVHRRMIGNGSNRTSSTAEAGVMFPSSPTDSVRTASKSFTNRTERRHRHGIWGRTCSLSALTT